MRGNVPTRLCVLTALLFALGCEGGPAGLNRVKLPGIPSADELEAAGRKAARKRREFRETKSPESIRWLLANRVKQGMSLSDVNNALGEDGELVENDASMKKRNLGFLLTDETRRWGPDVDGVNYILFFRKDRLVNHDPSSYR